MKPTIQAPWPYSLPADPASPTAQPNQPTDLGRALGSHLTYLTEQAQAGDPSLPPCCHDCAFRRGTDPNGCESTLMDAIKCVLEGEPFYCHVDKNRLCAGWVAARKELRG